jgi:phosphoglycerol transferase
VQVSVLADEYLYLLDAHYKGLDEATYPNYLFQWIYSSTKMCGTEFYSCARSINAFFVIFGAIFIYLLAKHIGRSKWLGALAAVAAILGSYGTYTAYFMPEAIFNGLMMVFFWALIRFGKSDNLLVWAAIGTSLGIASLAKPHGLFVIPAIVIFVILWTRATKTNWFIAALLRAVVFVVAVVGSKFLFGYLLAGERGLSLFGMYGTFQSIVGSATSTLLLDADPSGNSGVFFTGWGQVLMVTLVVGLAVPISIWSLTLTIVKPVANTFQENKFGALIGLSLLNMMAAIALFESIIQSSIWMHTRYYTYLIPLSTVVLVEALRSGRSEGLRGVRYAVVSLFSLIGLYTAVTNAAPYSSNWIDGPDFVFHIAFPAVSAFASLVGVATAIIWLNLQRLAISVALILSLSIATLSGLHNTSFLKANFAQGVWEHVALVLRGFLPQNELDRVLLVGQYEMLQRTAFSAMTGSASLQSPPEVPLERASLSKDLSWLVVVGDAPLAGFDSPTIRGGVYSLYALDPTNSIEVRTDQVLSFTGSCPEGEWSTWICEDEAEISLQSGFPAESNLSLIIEVEETIASVGLELSIGDSAASVQLEPGLSSLNLQFLNSSSAESLKIRITKNDGEVLPDKRGAIRVLWGVASRQSN